MNERALIRLDELPGLVCAFDADGILLFANKAYSAAREERWEDLRGSSFYEHFPLAECERIALRLASLETGESAILVHRVLDPRGALLWQEWTYQSLAGDNRDKRVFLALGHEVTERIEAEQAHGNRISELESRNEELEYFTYTVAHDLKSPLITIRGFLELLRRDFAAVAPARIENDLAQIDRAAGKMATRLEEILELSRFGRLVNSPRTIDLRQLAREACELVEGQIRERHAKIAIDPAMPSVYGDRNRLLEVFQNLIDNAVKYMGTQAQPLIEISATRQADEVLCRVADNGSGLAREQCERIFGLFERLNSDTEGTGVGLTLVRRIVDGHGGHVWAESEGIGCGTTICFSLPAPPGARALAAERAADGGAFA